VIGMVAALLPVLWKGKVFEPEPGDTGLISREMLYNVPTGIGFAVPSNLFYEISQLPLGVGTFEIPNRKRTV